MAFFERFLILLLLVILLLQVARRLRIPYPTMLAAAGVVVATLPKAPLINLDPRLALVLFIAPALLDAGYDLPARELRRYWRPLAALVVVAVILTAAAVAGVARTFAGLPWPAAVALGAIVAPPDAAAASAVLERFDLPRGTVSVLKGESLLNDATALLIFAAAVEIQTVGAFDGSTSLGMALAVPGGVIVGAVVAKAYLALSPHVAGTLGGTLFEFVTTFGTWLVAERLHLSAILAVVAYAMVIGRDNPERQRARDRIHSYSVWEAAVFLLNVVAFLLMGLQARVILARLPAAQLAGALGFAGLVLLTVVAVRVAWVMAYNRLAGRFPMLRGGFTAPTPAQGLLVSWCGMRGLVTLATAFALPEGFPGRDLIVLSAFSVVLGTLVFQGLTLGPLIRLLRLQPDASFQAELSTARTQIIDAALDSLDGHSGDAAENVRAAYQASRRVAVDAARPQAVDEVRQVLLATIEAQRRHLAQLRRSGDIDDDVFHALEEELDWDELAASPPERLTIEEI